MKLPCHRHLHGRAARATRAEPGSRKPSTHLNSSYSNRGASASGLPSGATRLARGRSTTTGGQREASCCRSRSRLWVNPRMGSFEAGAQGQLGPVREGAHGARRSPRRWDVNSSSPGCPPRAGPAFLSPLVNPQSNSQAHRHQLSDLSSPLRGCASGPGPWPPAPSEGCRASGEGGLARPVPGAPAGLPPGLRLPRWALGRPFQTE